MRRLLIAALLLLAAPAGASAHGIGGIVPDITPGTHLVRGPLARAAALDYEGGPVLHANRTHLVFWSPAGAGLSFDPGYEALMERFLTAVAADSHKTTNVYSLSGQYYDSAGPAAYDSTYGGAVEDTDPLPPNGCQEPPATGPGWTLCLTDAQLQQELEHIVVTAHLPRTGEDIYFLVLPEGLGTCTSAQSVSCALGGSATGFCGYHSQTADGLLYAVIPYNAVSGHCQSDNPRPNGSTADPALSTLSHEHNETVTDPETYSSWIDPSGEEEADLCITDFGPPMGGSGDGAWNEDIDGGHYYLQEEFSDATDACEQRAEPDHAAVALAGRPLAGGPLRVAAHASDPEGRIVSYLWSFGDGTASRRRASTHVFRRPGTYRIVLRVVDNWDNWTFASRLVRISAAGSRTRR